MDQAEQVGAGSVESVLGVEPCECRQHTCHLSPPRILDELEGRKCYRSFLISCIVLLVLTIILIIILRSIF